MIRTPTTFVIGAGASREFNLPLGDQLTKQIADALNLRNKGESYARELVLAALQFLANNPSALSRDWQEITMKALQISGQLATVPSIDAFIDNHVHDKDVEMIGKFGIAACLIAAERKSFLMAPHDPHPIDLAKVAKTWLARLFNILADGVRATKVQEMFGNVAFVVFNYDRCLEHYLQHAISSRFGMSLNEAGTLVREHCKIVHPYGLLGPVFADPSRVQFGEVIRSDMLGGGARVIEISQRIRTFTETSEGPERDIVRSYIRPAERLVFIGFGFQRQNVDLLRIESRGECNAFRATVLGMSASNQHEILRDIRNIARVDGFVGDGDDLLNLPGCDFITDESLFLAR